MTPINEERALACYRLGIKHVWVNFECPFCEYTFEIRDDMHYANFYAYLKPGSEFCCAVCNGNPTLRKTIWLEDGT